ncbi:alpha-ketoglutarate-dependent dioxygenase AlkB [Anaeromyxobacter dehalogenans]|uniref:2OG-Fe(II) oxygenase n=1 Tax=Anaeromyxobacter dehalogenans (strain 2CP-C) TaxID=290397 RepID=Q2IJF8_ANADE|nr:alpha-ketoglutarate-dependent dioxygenase AlkB [Anaeromyxobacter dehalogenans]ABC81785.1 2OG-Fe(II) oxygenase [Anaeromyxobacter dehalogenans 2CP-C]
MQLELVPSPVPALPPGMRLWPALLPVEEQQALLAAIAGVELGEVRMHGVTARRRVAHFGRAYAYDARALEPGPPLPPALESLRRLAAGLAGVEPAALVEALVTRYAPGAGIGWHRDAPAFGEVVGVSLGAPARLRMREGGPGGRALEVRLEPGSAYLLAGAARWRWQHAIPPVRSERWSVTFRTLRDAPAPP